MGVWEYKVHVIFAQPPAIGNPVVASRPLTPVPDLGGIVGPYEHNHYDKEVDPHVYTNVILLFYCQTLSIVLLIGFLCILVGKGEG